MLCPAVLCPAVLCSGVQNFASQHQACFEGQQSLMVQYKQRDVELMLVPVWVKDGAWQLAVHAMSNLLLGDCCGAWCCVGQGRCSQVICDKFVLVLLLHLA